MEKIKSLITQHFNVVLIASVFIGLFTPYLEHAPKLLGLFFISVAIFFSCSHITMDELRRIRVRPALMFYLVRFLIVPAVAFWGAQAVIPDYAMAVLLVSLAPVGASSTAVASLLKANTSLSLSATVVTNVLAPVTIPLCVYFLGGSDLKISMAQMFLTTGAGIFVPAFLYFFVVRRFESVKLRVRKESRFMSTICIAAMVAVVTAPQKGFILGNPDQVFWLSVYGMLLFAVYYLVAWLYGLRMEYHERKAYMLCSGVNNTGLAAGLAVLYFSPATVVFCILVEIPWILALIVFKKYVEKADRHYG